MAMWKSKPKQEKTLRCRLPRFFKIRIPVGSVWECPRCGDEWVVAIEPETYGNWDEPEWTRKYLQPRHPRNGGCGSWSCSCGPHPEQKYDTGHYLEPYSYPLLCMEHRRHLPCRRCT